MKNTSLSEFVEDVMNISVGYAGMGSASAAIFGASSTNDGITQNLRKNTIAFARERSKATPDQENLDQLANELQGSLLSLKLVNAISDQRLEELSSCLDKLSSSNI